MLFALRSVLIAIVAYAATTSAVSDHAAVLDNVGELELHDIGAEAVQNVHDLVAHYRDLLDDKTEMRYIRNLVVHYGDNFDEKPQKSLVEFGDWASPRFDAGDVNWDFGGKYVWLVPEYTTDPEAAATSFKLLLTNKPVAGLSDLAAGAGGKYRYLVREADTGVREKIFDASLLRCGSSCRLHGEGVMRGPDLNEGRGGSYLYLVITALDPEKRK